MLLEVANRFQAILGQGGASALNGNVQYENVCTSFCVEFAVRHVYL